jgi:hypothetical protein
VGEKPFTQASAKVSKGSCIGIRKEHAATRELSKLGRLIWTPVQMLVGEKGPCQQL